MASPSLPKQVANSSGPSVDVYRRKNGPVQGEDGFQDVSSPYRDHAPYQAHMQTHAHAQAQANGSELSDGHALPCGQSLRQDHQPHIQQQHPHQIQQQQVVFDCSRYLYTGRHPADFALHQGQPLVLSDPRGLRPMSVGVPHLSKTDLETYYSLRSDPRSVYYEDPGMLASMAFPRQQFSQGSQRAMTNQAGTGMEGRRQQQLAQSMNHAIMGHSEGCSRHQLAQATNPTVVCDPSRSPSVVPAIVRPESSNVTNKSDQIIRDHNEDNLNDDNDFDENGAMMEATMPHVSPEYRPASVHGTDASSSVEAHECFVR